MNDTKSIFMSKTLWGGLVLVAPVALKALGFEIGAGFEESATSLTEAITALIGSVLVVWGRFTATKTLVIKK